MRGFLFLRVIRFFFSFFFFLCTLHFPVSSARGLHLVLYPRRAPSRQWRGKVCRAEHHHKEKQHEPSYYHRLIKSSILFGRTAKRQLHLRRLLGSRTPSVDAPSAKGKAFGELSHWARLASRVLARRQLEKFCGLDLPSSIPLAWPCRGDTAH